MRWSATFKTSCSLRPASTTTTCTAPVYRPFATSLTRFAATTVTMSHSIGLSPRVFLPIHQATGYACQHYLVHVPPVRICIQCFDTVVGRQEGHMACKKTVWWGAGMVVCLEQGADLHIAQLIPLSLAVSCFSKIQVVFTFLVLAHLGSPGKRAVKWVCVCSQPG